MEKPKFTNIKLAYQRKGHDFLSRVNELNIFGIRSLSLIGNRFNDYIGAAYVSELGIPVLWIAPATTDPGETYLKNPMNANGCAALVEGLYVDSHKQGMHRGAYPALVQCGSLRVFRDNNKDAKLDLLPDTIEKGAGFGINIHRANANSATDLVNNFSAGCQVFKLAADLEYLLFLCDKHVQAGNKKTFNYTLFNEVDVK